YNQKTLRRLCENIEINTNQKEAAQRWLSLLKNKELQNEKNAYIEFANTILNKLLNYDVGIESLKHEKDYMEFPFRYADGSYAIFFEAKGTKTIDLFAKQHRYKVGYETPVSQTWAKMSEYPIPYGVCTNYREFVLFDYSKGNTKYHFFDFLDIQDDENKFKEFIAIFSKNQIIVEKFLEKLYTESIIEEKTFSNEFYKIFHETRLMLIKEFLECKISKENAINYAQLFLNRMIFIYFAESTGKMSRRIFQKDILKILGTVMIFGKETHLIYDIIIRVFDKLDKGSEDPIEIFGFDGELFSQKFPDSLSFKDLRKENYFEEIFMKSAIKIRPELDIESKKIIKLHKGRINPIIKNLLILGSFDFKTEVNVNILGHIFEQSISDIEMLKGGKIKGKRRREGIYYTPEFVTEFICKNTIIPFLSKSGVNEIPELIKEYSKDIEELEKKVNNIKILDPACGSGAFLLKAIDILTEIKRDIIDYKNFLGEYKTELNKTVKSSLRPKKNEKIIFDSILKFNEIAEIREIIKNNIFGVDLNEESVEITKLSIFFKICKKNEKLMTLKEIIKCGDSLIDDPKATPKAFNWEDNFSEILNKSKFDIIIGNPPWGAESEDEKLDYLKKKYEKVSFRTVNSFKMFIERSLSLLSKDGCFGFIIPNGLIEMPDYTDVRKLLINFSKNLKIIDLGDDIFEDVNYPSCIVTFSSNSLTPNTIQLKDLKFYSAFQLTTYELEKNNFKTIKIDDLDDKLRFKIDELSFLNDYTIAIEDKYFVIFGVKVYQTGKGKSKLLKDSKQIPDDKKNNVYLSKIKTKEHSIKFIDGINIGKFIHLWKEGYEDCYINYGDHLAESRNIEIFKKPKIVIQQIVNKTISASLINDFYIVKNTCALINQKDANYSLLYLLGLLNSKFMVYIHLKRSANATKKSFPKLNSNDIKSFPIPSITKENSNLIKQLEENTRSILELQKKYKDTYDTFIEYILINFEIDLTKIFYKLHYELKKGKEDFFNLLKKSKLVLENESLFKYILKTYKTLKHYQDDILNFLNSNDDLVFKLYKLEKVLISEVENLIEY
ncbi:MAG: Eco57I restriction-modification methylase domain-containing protein, partial [Promethearchaeota archaeon]